MPAEGTEMKRVHEGVGDAPGATEPVPTEEKKGSSTCLIVVGVVLVLAVLLAIGLGVGLGVDWDSDSDNGKVNYDVTTSVVLSLDGVTVSHAAQNIDAVKADAKKSTGGDVVVTCNQLCQAGTCYNCNGTTLSTRAAEILAPNPIDIYLTIVGKFTSAYVLSHIDKSSSSFAATLSGTWLSSRTVPQSNMKVFSPFSFGTAQAWGPDGRLYVASGMGTVTVVTFNSSLQVDSSMKIATLYNTLTGIAVHPTSTVNDIKLYISGFPFQGKLNTGSVWMMNGSADTWSTPKRVISGLPRSVGQLPHGVTGIHFDSNNVLFISSGGLTACGAEVKDDPSFASGEVPLSNAILTADFAEPNFDGVCYNEGADPYAEPNCTLGIYATGLRNSYDFVFHSNGKIYATDNGHQDIGAFPTSGTPPCGGYGNPSTSNPGDQPDVINYIQKGKYYGQPNPTRDECAYHNGSFQGVAAPKNYQPPLATVGMRASANGITEYRSPKCPSLTGGLVFVRYATGDDVMSATLGSDGTTITKLTRLVTGLTDPLSISEKDGDLYVTTAGFIVVVRLAC
eukprot:TRINITY_DN1962_c1_g4_i2.p1 TRINITY_DN1962_c1_g4~~TRINITY_DN1962_c1_g4_i2.p1  ORF type:complete len:564 (+),score=131.78 TRINITY_DN1962_c1_g4_i2:78-1769(+)